MDFGIQDVIYYVTPLIGALVKEVRDIIIGNRKRKLFIKILRENSAIEECFDLASKLFRDYLNPKIINYTYYLIILSSFVFFVVYPYFKYHDLKTSALISLLGFIALGPLYFLIMTTFVVISMVLSGLSKDKWVYSYWVIRALEAFIIGNLIASYFFYAYLYNSSKLIGIDETQLTNLFLIILMIVLVLLFVSVVSSRPGVNDIKKLKNNEAIARFRFVAPYVVVATPSGLIEGRIWNIYDDVLQIKNLGVISIPWNNILWIEVID